MAAVLKPQPTPNRFYLPELDTLRFVAFLAVFIGHGVVISGLWHLAVGKLHDLIGCVANIGFFGVDLFFVLSAYLLTELMVREKESSGRLDVPGFYIRRMLRIWPLYYLSLAVAFIIGGDRVILMPFAMFVGNFATMAWTVGPALGTLWSISVEEQFYLFWPLIVRDSARGQLKSVAIRLWSVAVLGRFALLLMGTPPDALWENTLSHIDSLACGILLSSTGLRCSWRGALVAAGSSLWIAGSLLRSTEVGIVLTYPCVGVGAAAFLLAILGARTPIVRQPMLVYLGRISYGLYVFHVPILLFTARWIGSSRAWPLCLVCAMGITGTAAAISYRWLESPFLRLKRRFEHVASRPV